MMKILQVLYVYYLVRVLFNRAVLSNFEKFAVPESLAYSF
jgi:hypothetical protein